MSVRVNGSSSTQSTCSGASNIGVEGFNLRCLGVEAPASESLEVAAGVGVMASVYVGENVENDRRCGSCMKLGLAGMVAKVPIADPASDPVPGVP